MQYSCFHLEVAGKRINDFVELSEVPEVTADSTLTLVEDPYTEKEARMHVVRIRELIGASGDRTDTIHGINAGLSLHDHITEMRGLENGHAANGSSGEAAGITDYKFEAPGSIKSLLPPDLPPSPKTVKSISLSPWNPPPYHLRTKGHLLYLAVTTNEGEQYQITSHVSGFYVNKSTHNKFDPSPKPAPKNHKAHSLLTLLENISPSFDASFRQLLEYNGKREPLALFQLANAIPASPWMVQPPAAQPEHQSDIARTQESYLLQGAESTETLRDWNEEFQSTRELPKESVQDKVFRERLTSKLFADYNEAATRGAVLVARGEVPPLNPTEGRDAQIFVYNNVFFSFGADGVGTFATDGGDEAARVATGKDVMGVKAVNQLDINGLFTPGTVVVDYLGKRIVGQSIVPGIFKQREPGEHQIDYGGVEGKDVVADDQTFAPLFEKLSQQLHVSKHPVWDKEKKRHDLEGSVETKGLLGTDGRKYVLDLYRITPLDVTWLEQHWGETQEEKEGSSKKDYPHRMAVLRPELVESYARMKLREYVDAQLAKKTLETSEAKAEEPKVNGHANDEKDEAKPAEPEEKEEKADQKDKKEELSSEDQPRVDISAFKFALNPDVFSGQAPQTDEEKEQYAKDEAEVRAVCKYLTETTIPRLFADVQEGDVGFPMDSESLTTLFHKRGVNLRYLGMIAKKAASDDSPRIKALERLAVQEMVVRGFKHVANEYLRHLPAAFAPAAVSHLLNCLIGLRYNAKPQAETDDGLRLIYPETDFSYERITPDSLRKEVVEQMRIRFRFELNGDLVPAGKELQILREVALKLGLQVTAREYLFGEESVQLNTAEPSTPVEAAPATNGTLSGQGKKKKKGKGDGSPRSGSPTPTQPNVTFHPDDILNFVPMVKEASPKVWPRNVLFKYDS
jgi:protein TIF31